MALATYRHNETGELIELSEDWLKRFPKDPYTLVDTDELAKIEVEHRQATAKAVGAQPFDPGEETPTDDPAPAPASPPAPPAGKSTNDDEDDESRARRF